MLGIKPVPLNEQTMAQHLTRTYDGSRDQCFAATLGALSELGIEVDSKDAEKGSIVTKRKEFTATKVVQSGGGTSATGGRVAPTTTQLSAQQAYKYYLQVDKGATDDKCVVRARRFRAWNQGAELKELNLNFAKPQIWDPFLNEIGEELRTGAGGG